MAWRRRGKPAIPLRPNRPQLRGIGSRSRVPSTRSPEVIRPRSREPAPKVSQSQNCTPIDTACGSASSSPRPRCDPVSRPWAPRPARRRPDLRPCRRRHQWRPEPEEQPPPLWNGASRRRPRPMCTRSRGSTAGGFGAPRSSWRQKDGPARHVRQWPQVFRLGPTPRASLCNMDYRPGTGESSGRRKKPSR